MTKKLPIPEILGALQTVDQHRRRATTGHALGQRALTIALVLACCFWVQAYWLYVTPQWAPVATALIAVDLGGLLSAVTVAVFETLLIGTMALLFALIPPIFWSALVPSTAANMLLSEIQVKHGWPGLLFSTGVALLLSMHAYTVLLMWWTARPAIAALDAAGPAVVLFGTAITHAQQQTLISLLFMIGIPAWALNRVTPEQWRDLVEQALAVRRIKHQMQLEDSLHRVARARAVALLDADVTSMTLEQYGMRNRELAALLAAANQASAQAFTSIARSWKSLYGIEAALHPDGDDDRLRIYREVARLLDTTAQRYDATATYAHSLVPAASSGRPPDADGPVVAAPDVTRSPMAQPEAESDAASGRPRTVIDGPPRTAADRDGPPPRLDTDITAWEPLTVVAQAVGQQAFRRQEVEQILKIQKSAAADAIRQWKARGWVRDLAEPKFHYQIEATVFLVDS